MQQQGHTQTFPPLREHSISSIPFLFHIFPGPNLKNLVHPFLTMKVAPTKPFASAAHRQESVLATCSSAILSQAARFLSLLCLDCIYSWYKCASHMRLQRLSSLIIMMLQLLVPLYPLIWAIEPPPCLYNNALFCPTCLHSAHAHIHGPAAGSSNS